MQDSRREHPKRKRKERSGSYYLGAEFQRIRHSASSPGKEGEPGGFHEGRNKSGKKKNAVDGPKKSGKGLVVTEKWTCI